MEKNYKHVETSVAQRPCRAQPGGCSERGEARHFDIDVSDVDVAGNLWQVHVLHGRDGAGGGRRQTALLKQNMRNTFKAPVSVVLV